MVLFMCFVNASEAASMPVLSTREYVVFPHLPKNGILINLLDTSATDVNILLQLIGWMMLVLALCPWLSKVES